MVSGEVAPAAARFWTVPEGRYLPGDHARGRDERPLQRVGGLAALPRRLIDVCSDYTFSDRAAEGLAEA